VRGSTVDAKMAHMSGEPSDPSSSPAGIRTVLFLCSGNYYRSRFAEIVFNRHAARLRLPWRADSRGFRLNPQNIGPISIYARERLQSLGIESEAIDRLPRAAVAADLAAAALIIALKEAEHRAMARERFPAWVDRIEYWHIHDLDCAAPSHALSELERAIDALVERLSAEG
jgi:low molecular weight protein-tyrosine phosphatase